MCGRPWLPAEAARVQSEHKFHVNTSRQSVRVHHLMKQSVFYTLFWMLTDPVKRGNPILRPQRALCLVHFMWPNIGLTLPKQMVTDAVTKYEQFVFSVLRIKYIPKSGFKIVTAVKTSKSCLEPLSNTRDKESKERAVEYFMSGLHLKSYIL